MWKFGINLYLHTLQTIFELNRSQKSLPFSIMKVQRAKHTNVIEKYRNKMEEIEKEEANKQLEADEKEEVCRKLFLYTIKRCFHLLLLSLCITFRLTKQTQMKSIRHSIKLLHQKSVKTLRIFIMTRRRKRKHMPRIVKIIFLISRQINTPKTV